MYLELIIEQTKQKEYIAKCPLFPKCKGLAIDKESAIKKLCKSISYFISKNTTNLLENRLLSKDYSEIITNPSHKKENTFQHRVIDMVPSDTNNQHTIFLQSLKNHPSFQNDTIENDTIENNIKIKEEPDSDSSLDPLKSEDDHNPLFGISLCLN